MSEEKKKIKRISIDKLLASYFVNREIFMKRVYTVRVDPAKENKYMIITSEGFEIYDASKKVDVDIEVLNGVELLSKYSWEDFISVDVDKFAMHTHYQFDTGLSLRIDTHNDLTNQLQKHNVGVKLVERKWFNKILGYRSQKKWKIITASIFYLLLVLVLVNAFIGKESNNKEDIAETSPVSSKVTTEKKSAEEEINDLIKKEEQKQPKDNIPEFNIEKQRLDKSGMWYLTLRTPSKDEKELKLLVEHTKNLAKKQSKTVHSIFVYVLEEGSVSKMYTATGKIALTDKGSVQTGLATKDMEYEYKVQPEDIKSKPEKVVTPKHSGPSADDVLTAFEDAGYAVPEPRDNSHNCPDLGCTKLITTEAVSIYEWPTESKAKEVHKFYDYQSGPITIRFNQSHNSDGSIEYEPKPDKESYQITLDKLTK